MSNDDINDYMPSILNPRGVKKQYRDLTLTQNSIVSRCSLSLKKKNGFSNVKKNLHKTFPLDKENSQNNNNLFLRLATSTKDVSSHINNNTHEADLDFLSFEELNDVFPINKPKQNTNNLTPTKKSPKLTSIQEGSLGISAIEDLNTVRNNLDSSPLSFGDIEIPINNETKAVEDNRSLISVSSATDLIEQNLSDTSGNTIIYEYTDTKVVLVSFGVNNCDTLDVSAKHSNIKNITITHKDNATNIECEVMESSQVDSEKDIIMEDKKDSCSPTSQPKLAVAVNLEIKKNNTDIDKSKVLILNTNAIEKLSHVIVQPPNRKLVKRKIFDTSKIINSGKRKAFSSFRNGETVCEKLKQKRIDSYINKSAVDKSGTSLSAQTEDVKEMSKNLSVPDTVKSDRIRKAGCRGHPKQNAASPKTITVTRRELDSPRPQTIKISNSEAVRPPSRTRNGSASSHSPRKNVDSIQFTLPKSSSNKIAASLRRMPHYKIVAGTHFAVDAFSYGEIPNVKHYFLTHFHSDHYSGLKKSFNKLLFCSKITADLCVSRLGVSPNCIRVINNDETLTVEGVEVTAVDANHCPGALMLAFTLPNGKTLLHTGDFRASPHMESYPVFWNKDIHTIYLDTTYCNARYDFPTQEQSLEMALYLLRQKKLDLEKSGKKFSSVLIVCGTYTIGKEKFFLGMARRVGCSVWACPEKDRVLQAVEGRSFSHAPPASCQLHVVPMRDLTHEKLRSYLDSLKGAFQEVVAFKPSGWENGRNSCAERDLVTIHGIPYSEHSSFSELIRFVKFVKPKQVVPTVDISGGVKSVQKYFPCPLVCQEDSQSQSRLTDFFSIESRQHAPAVT